jgi:hypothetical protein
MDLFSLILTAVRVLQPLTGEFPVSGLVLEIVI